jgi:hypothetical protein
MKILFVDYIWKCELRMVPFFIFDEYRSKENAKHTLRVALIGTILIAYVVLHFVIKYW